MCACQSTSCVCDSGYIYVCVALPLVCPIISMCVSLYLVCISLYLFSCVTFRCMRVVARCCSVLQCAALFFRMLRCLTGCCRCCSLSRVALCCVIRGVVCIRDVGCVHPGYAPYLARIRCQKVRCVHPSKESFWLRTSLFQKTLACIRFRNDPCTHLFSSH